MSKAARFFSKTKQGKKDINYKFKEKDFGLSGYGNKITPEDCWEQIRDWASDLAREQIKKTPEGKVLATLEENKRASYKEIMEAGSPDSLKEKLHTNLTKRRVELETRCEGPAAYWYDQLMFDKPGII